MVPSRPHLAGTPYVLDQLIGAGAMGEVWLGEHTGLGRRAVIKLIHLRYRAEPQAVARMRREARIVANLRHHALATIYDLGETAEGRTYIAMEWLEGSVLRETLRRRGALPPHEACELAVQALEGLHAAHEAGVVHRDVKPENLFVTLDGRLKVLDFGVAKPIQDGNMTGARTAVGIVLGTPRYMAPEQALGRTLTPATDVYALGCVLYEMCAGRPVFEGASARDLLYAHIHEQPAPLVSKARRPFDPRLEAAVLRALEKDPSRRFASAADMAAALRALTTTRRELPARAPSEASAAHAAVGARVRGGEAGDTDLTRRCVAARWPVGTRTTERAISQTPPPVMVAAAVASAKTAATEVLPAHDVAPRGTAHAAAPDATPASAPRPSSGVRPVARLLTAAAVGAALTGGTLSLVPPWRGTSRHIAAAPVVAASSSSIGAPVSPAVAEATERAAAEPSAPVASERRAPASVAPADAAASRPPAGDVRLEPTTPVERALRAIEEGDLERAERYGRLAGDGVAERLLLADILERRGKAALAREVYRKLLASEPTNALARTRLARLGG